MCVLFIIFLYIPYNIFNYTEARE